MLNEEVAITRKKNKNKAIFWIFFALIGFITILYPLFGSNLKFVTGDFFSRIFRMLGMVCTTVGALILVWGVLTLFCTRSFKAISIMLLGFFLIIIGSFWFNPGTFGVFTHGREVPKGFH
jgi:hypothetical protein